ncbi:MAG: flippase-like domain-containing protein [Lachnospiraceae bacterium]|nr:flippase-like domain-containing protein [Lachnospiraceae bacterium]
MNIKYIALATAVIAAAHFVRILRWRMFIGVYEKPDTRNLTQALSLGYLAGCILPFKLGDLLRIFYAGKRMKNGKTLALSTVVVDRYLDVLCVGVIFAGLYLSNLGSGLYRSTTISYMTLGALLLVFTVFVWFFRGYLKRAVRAVAGIFAPRIEEKLLKISWALIWNFKDMLSKLNKPVMVLVTLFMWALYILSYALFAVGVGGEGWESVFTSLFAGGAPLYSLVSVAGSAEGEDVAMMAFMVLPSLVMLLISLLIKKQEALPEQTGDYLQLFPHIDDNERLRFLENYFSDDNREYLSVYLKINQNISIIRDYSAGSNATTMLCTDGVSTFYRKYAFGQDAQKLSDQTEWISSHSGVIPLPGIVRCEKDSLYCYYDMPYENGTSGFFEYIHSMPFENSRRILFEILETLDKKLYTKRRRATHEEISLYIEKKVTANLERIRGARALKGLLEHRELVINGRTYNNLSFYEDMLSKEKLTGCFEGDECCDIHGDLTVENIVCRRAGETDDYYLIDPNGGNILESPLLDIAKLLQSFHGGYEFIMAVKSVRVEGNRIDFMYTGSAAYESMLRSLSEYMEERFDKEQIKRIYLHETVHWLRLMPYKLARSETAAAFFAAMLMALSDVSEKVCD